MNKIKKLIAILNEARKAYYSEDFEIMSNFEYDKLYNELENLEKDECTILSNSPTRKVGYEVLSELKKVKHNEKMLSLDKTKSISKLENFLEDNKAILSFKIDGLTIVLNYEDGKLLKAITRGNGEVGEDVTHNIKMFNNIPIEISYKGNLIIRGEAYISFSEFNKINQELPDERKYKNTRNLCSGTVRQLNNEVLKNRRVSFLAFSLVKCDKKFTLKSQELQFLKSLEFDIITYVITDKNKIKNDIEIFGKELTKNDFGADGLVITFDDIKHSKSLGVTSKFPKDSIAFKWRDETQETSLIEVKWNTSRTGFINPIAVFEPIQLEGTTVTKASLHNVSIIKELKLGIKDIITVYKANMIIPQIAENLTKSDTLEIPKNCPVCEHKTTIIKLREGLALKCENLDCPARILNSICHYVSRNAMNIEGLSKATLDKFIENNFISNFYDLYNLEKYEDEIIVLNGFGQKSYDNIIKSIEKSRNVTLENFINALGIEHIGLSNAKILVNSFNYDFKKIQKATFDELQNLDGFGEKIAKVIVEYFDKPQNIELINKIYNILIITENTKSQNKQILEGKTFVVTGKLFKYTSRKEIIKEIEDLGGKVSSSISKQTNYLINNNITSASEKNKKANDLNIQIIDEQQFLDLLLK